MIHSWFQLIRHDFWLLKVLHHISITCLLRNSFGGSTTHPEKDPIGKHWTWPTQNYSKNLTQTAVWSVIFSKTSWYSTTVIHYIHTFYCFLRVSTANSDKKKRTRIDACMQTCRQKSSHAHKHTKTHTRLARMNHSHNTRDLQSVNELPLRNLIIKQSSKASAHRDNSRLSLTVAL